MTTLTFDIVFFFLRNIFGTKTITDNCITDNCKQILVPITRIFANFRRSINQSGDPDRRRVFFQKKKRRTCACHWQQAIGTQQMAVDLVYFDGCILGQ